MARKHEPGIAAADRLRLFPTLVWKAELEPNVRRRIHKDITRKLDEIRRSLP